MRVKLIDEKLYLHEISVLPEFQGRGVGSMMIDWAKRQGGACGLDIVAWVTSEAVGFYEKMGFQMDEEEVRQMSFTYSKRLGDGNVE